MAKAHLLPDRNLHQRNSPRSSLCSSGARRLGRAFARARLRTPRATAVVAKPGLAHITRLIGHGGWRSALQLLQEKVGNMLGQAPEDSPKMDTSNSQ